MLLSIAVPVYNEREVLPEFLNTLRRVMAADDHDYEIVFVDDGSVDGTSEFLQDAAADDPRIKVLFFSRNFGHQVAITAALDHTSGDVVAVMDADLQDLKATVPGWTSLIVLNVIFSGAILTAIGLVGDYLARIYEEAKARPLYIVANSMNFSPGVRGANGVVLPPAPAEAVYARTARKATRV